MNLDYLLTHKSLFPSVIGITCDQFDQIVNKVHPILYRELRVRALKPDRIRAVGAGRKRKLQTTEQLVFLILFYYKVYPTFRLAQFLFELDKRNIQLWTQFMEPVLFEALGYELQLPVQRVKSIGQLLLVCPDLTEFIVDATERPINRPKDPTNQTHYYSGKKKRHTVKNQLTVHPKTGRILSVSQTVEGKRHDKKLAEDDFTILRAPPGAVGLADSGYQGGEAINPTITFIYPTKKPKGKELSDEDKKTNKHLSQIRVRVEHPISYLKHFNILYHTFRGAIKRADIPFQTIACLYNCTRPATC